MQTGYEKITFQVQPDHLSYSGAGDAASKIFSHRVVFFPRTSNEKNQYPCVISKDKKQETKTRKERVARSGASNWTPARSTKGARNECVVKLIVWRDPLTKAAAWENNKRASTLRLTRTSTTKTSTLLMAV